MHFSLRSAMSLIVALWMSLWTASAAQAHAEFRGSEPEPDAVLATMPQAVTLQFSEDVGVLALSWLLPDGTEATAEADVHSGMLHASPPAAKGDGSYTLKWRVASADGHPVGGALVFSIGHASGAHVVTTPDFAAYLAVALRSAMVLALVLSVGAAVYAATVGPIPPEPNLMLRRAAWFVPLAGIALIGVEGADRIGTLSAVLSAQGWRAGLSAPTAQAVGLSVVAAGLAFLRPGRKTAFAAWAVASASFVVAGHARAEPWPLVPLTFLHAAAALFWIGGLLPLAAAVFNAKGKDRAAQLRAFSKPALPLVLLLLASGGAIIFHRADAPAILASAWAALLAVKLTLVAAMLALALLHRVRTMPALEAGQDPFIGLSLKSEAIIGLLVLILVMGFRLAPPPAFERPHPPMTHFQNGTIMVMLSPSAQPPGLVAFTMQVTDRAKPAFAPQEISLALTDPASGIGPIKAEARLQDGRWKTEAVTLPTKGPWHATISVLVSDFEAVKLDAEIRTPN